MNKNTSATKNGQSLRVLSYFCLAVFLLIGISLSIKVFVTMSKSAYDGTHRFTVVFLQKNAFVISFSPESSKISILPISTKKLTRAHISNTLHIPIDASVLENTKQNEPTDPAATMQHVFFSLSHIDTNLTFVDAFRLWMFAQSNGEQGKIKGTISNENIETIDSATLDKTVSSLFLDSTLSNENKSIQIINSTGVSGIGNMFAQMLTNSGGNVVSVLSGHSDEKQTSIRYTDPSSYTVSKLEKILQVKATALPKKEIFDIIITLGSDKVGLLKE